MDLFWDSNTVLNISKLEPMKVAMKYGFSPGWIMGGFKNWNHIVFTLSLHWICVDFLWCLLNEKRSEVVTMRNPPVECEIDFQNVWWVIKKHGEGPQTSQWLHNERDGVSNHWRLDCWLNRLFRRRPKKTPKLCITGLCGGNSQVTDEFPAQMAINTITDVQQTGRADGGNTHKNVMLSSNGHIFQYLLVLNHKQRIRNTAISYLLLS